MKEQRINGPSLGIDIFYVLGMLLTTASQLRFGGSPLGLGEVCLILWMGLLVLHYLLAPKIAMGPAFASLLWFWGLMTIALSLGTLVAFTTGEDFDPTWFLHDTLAYPLVAVVSCASVIEPGAAARLRRAAWPMVVLGAIAMDILIAGGFGLVPLPFDVWFWERFRGWSQNPNQLALLCCVLALVALHLADTARGAGSRVVALLCMAVITVAGRLTQSDFFAYALALAVPVYAGLKLRIWMSSRGLRAAAATLLMIGTPAMAVSLFPVTFSPGSDATALVSVLSKNGGKEAKHEADLRFSLWREAIGRGIRSGFLGLGPGPHLIIPPEMVVDHTEGDQPGDVTHPTPNGTANFESHNTFLDLFTQGGALALGAFAWLLLEASRRAYRSGAAGLVALMAGVALSVMTADMIRMPIVWFGLALCLAAEPGTEGVPQVETRQVLCSELNG
jgi:O-antigen ligase